MQKSACCWKGGSPAGCGGWGAGAPASESQRVIEHCAIQHSRPWPQGLCTWSVANMNWDVLWGQNTHWILKQYGKKEKMSRLLSWLYVEMIFYMLGKKIEHIFTRLFLLFDPATRKFKIISVVPIVFLLDSVALNYWIVVH